MAPLLHNTTYLVFLEAPFSHDAIDAVVKELLNNKCTWHDDSNAEFVRKCWHHVKKYFYDLCDQFHQGNVCLQSINSCFITLVPKKDHAKFVHDFRSTSL
jgi:hypothetical protein